MQCGKSSNSARERPLTGYRRSVWRALQDPAVRHFKLFVLNVNNSCDCSRRFGAVLCICAVNWWTFQWILIVDFLLENKSRITLIPYAYKENNEQKKRGKFTYTRTPTQFDSHTFVFFFLIRLAWCQLVQCWQPCGSKLLLLASEKGGNFELPNSVASSLKQTETKKTTVTIAG